jgi:hypothetical protein
MTKNPHYHSLDSHVVHSAESKEEIDGYTVELDENFSDQNFELRGLKGLRGYALEERMLLPPGPRVKRYSGDQIEEIEDDEKAIRDAINHNPYKGIYDQWRLHAPEWMRDLDAAIRQRLRQLPEVREAMKTSPDIVLNMIKPVPCIQRSLDLHRGVDCLFVFHDPEALELNRMDAFGDSRTTSQPGKEAFYWDPEHDTIVTVDVTADIAFKEQKSHAKGAPFRADVVVSKFHSVANPGLKRLVSEELGMAKPKQNWDERIAHHADLIVAMYLAKKEYKVPALRNLRAERLEREEQQKRWEEAEQRSIEEERRQTAERTKELMEKREKNRQKQKVKKGENRKKSRLHLEAKEARKKMTYVFEDHSKDSKKR